MPTSHELLENESYLQKQIKQIITELDEGKQRVSASEDETAKYYAACEQATSQMETLLKSAIQKRLQVIKQQAKKDALKKALTLKPVSANDKKVLVALWIALIFILPLLAKYVLEILVFRSSFLMWFYFLVPLLKFVPSVWLYKVMVQRGIKREAEKSMQAQCASMLSFGQSSLTLMHFDDKESGNPNFPYCATRAPENDREILTEFTVKTEYGKFFGADLVIFYSLKQNGERELGIQNLLILPTNGNQAQFIPVNANKNTQEWKWHESVALELAPEFAKHAATIQQLATYGAVWAKECEFVNALSQRLKTLTAVVENWSDVAIEEQTLDRILKLVDLFISGRRPAPKGILLYGPPGTGKTLIARKLAKHADCHFESVNIADLKAGYIGQTAPRVQALWQKCRNNAPTILFVDECESVFASRGSTDTDAFGNELVQTFLSEWDGFNQSAGQVLVIAATNRRENIDNAILSRFTTSVEIALPNEKARKRILQNELQEAGIELDIPAALITETTGMSGRDLHTLIASVVAEHIDRHLTPETLLNQVRSIRNKGSTQVKSLGWDDVVLPQATLNEFQNLGKELRNAEKLAQLGISTPKGILLYGPPGTGKTQIARVLAGQSGLSFIAASTSDLKANFIGQSGSKVKQLFEKARSQAPSILFIDEIDIVAPSRGSDGGDTFTQEIIGQLLQELDGVSSQAGQVFLLAASNHPDRIDSALLSRLERKIEIGLPDVEARAKIISMMLQEKPVSFDITQVAKLLAEQTEGQSGRDLSSLVTRATRQALNRTLAKDEDVNSVSIQQQDLEAALLNSDAVVTTA